mmetsp:Transcript_440/g.1433  ORF Transcript_440/g.1433 Transcript_440/m.1433 type:complete len:334 (+) Transcript_440:6345-7346(+)
MRSTVAMIQPKSLEGTRVRVLSRGDEDALRSPSESALVDPLRLGVRHSCRRIQSWIPKCGHAFSQRKLAGVTSANSNRTIPVARGNIFVAWWCARLLFPPFYRGHCVLSAAIMSGTLKRENGLDCPTSNEATCSLPRFFFVSSVARPTHEILCGISDPSRLQEAVHWRKWSGRWSANINLSTADACVCLDRDNRRTMRCVIFVCGGFELGDVGRLRLGLGLHLFERAFQRCNGGGRAALLACAIEDGLLCSAQQIFRLGHHLSLLCLPLGASLFNRSRYQGNVTLQLMHLLPKLCIFVDQVGPWWLAPRARRYCPDAAVACTPCDPRIDAAGV